MTGTKHSWTPGVNRKIRETDFEHVAGKSTASGARDRYSRRVFFCVDRKATLLLKKIICTKLIWRLGHVLKRLNYVAESPHLYIAHEVT